MAIEACQDLRSYFFERLRAAQAQLQHPTDHATEHYLVELLARFGRTESKHTGAPPAMKAAQQDADAPLVLQVAKADAASDPQERFQRFRQVGDVALYSCGVFPEGLARRGVTHTYMATMGRRAYGQAGSLARYSSEPFQQVYPKLGCEFEAISRVLTEAVDESPPRTPAQIVKLYRTWVRTGSERIAAKLRAAGVTLEKDERDN